MTTKFGIGIVFRKAQVSAKYNCPTSTVTLFSEYGETRIHSSPVIQSQKRPANSGGTIVYNYPCYVRRRGWMPTGLLFVPRCTLQYRFGVSRKTTTQKKTIICRNIGRDFSLSSFGKLLTCVDL